MKIQNVEAEYIAACASFQFKEWTISFSTIFGGISVLAWITDHPDNTTVGFSSVEAAINYIIRR